MGFFKKLFDDILGFDMPEPIAPPPPPPPAPPKPSLDLTQVEPLGFLDDPNRKTLKSYKKSSATSTPDLLGLGFGIGVGDGTT